MSWFFNFFELVICKSIQDTKIWGRLKLDMWAINFWWGSCKISSESRSWFYKTFPSFFSSETWLYIFLVVFVWKSFSSNFSSEFNVPWHQQNFHQTSSIKPCLVPSFLHCFKNLLLMNHLFEALNDLHVHFDPNLLMH
jgi:hypothetical protein